MRFVRSLSVLAGTALTALLWASSCLCAPARAPQPAPPWTFLDDVADGPFDLAAEMRIPGAGEARICFAYVGATRLCYARFTKQSVSLLRVAGGTTTALAPPRPLKPALPATPVAITIRCRGEAVDVLRGDEVLLKTKAACPDGSKVGIACSGTAQGKLVRMQRVDTPHFSDDFMQNGDYPSPWEPLSGKWGVSAIISHAERSQNGFLYQGEGSPGLTAVGFPFWDDYAVHASFTCPDEGGEVGVAAYCRDAGNYFALLWSGSAGLRVLRVRDGAPTILAQRQMLPVPNQWYRLTLQVYHGYLTGLVDGHVCLEARDTTFVFGKAALYVKGRGVYFDDVAVEPATYFHVSAMAGWQSVRAGAGTLRVFPQKGWGRYVIRTTIAPTGHGSVDTLFAWRDPANYALFRWRAAGAKGAAAARQLICVTNNQPRAVAEAPGGYVPGRTYPVAISVRPAYAAVSVAEEDAFDAADPGLAGGSIARGASDTADTEVWLAPETPATASSGWQWQVTGTPLGTVWWGNKSRYGDVAVRLPVVELPDQGKAAVLMAPVREDPAKGCLFGVQRISQSQGMLRVAHGGETSKEVSIPLGRTLCLDVARRGTLVLAVVDGSAVLSWRQKELWQGTYVGIQASDADILVRNALVCFDSMAQYHSSPQEMTGAWYFYRFREAR